MRTLVALAGRPNTGKTTLFNALTGLRQRVANFAGCTVEKAVGVLEAEETRLELVDLPGTLAILPATEDERVALRFLSETASSASPLRVLCLAEASNLPNDLALALSLKDCGYPTSLVVNMIDEATKNGIRIDRRRLEEESGMPVFLTCARSGQGLKELEDFLLGSEGASGEAIDLRTAPSKTLREIHSSAQRRALALADRAMRGPEGRLLTTISKSVALDRWLFHPLAGPLVLAVVLFALFEALFALGGPMGEQIASGLSWLSAALRPALPAGFLRSLLLDGAMAGISAVASFVPQIALLFLLIGLLEQSGYLPRAGAMVDRALRPFGLDGKVFIPLLSSFACAIPGVMATRTIQDSRRRIATILLCPLMTCSARIPVYTLIISAFVPGSLRVLGFNAQGLVMAGMYLFGVLAALALALALKATALFEAQPSPVTILPPYRFPKLQELARYVWLRCWHFLSKAGKVIFALSLLLWALASFPKNREGRAPLEAEIAVLSRQAPSPERERRVRELEGLIGALDMESSLLGRLGRAVEPVFSPIGYDWKLSIAVLSSIAAREVFVGTLGSLFALSGEAEPSEGLLEALRRARAPDGSPRYTLATAVSLLLFFALALQCLSTLAIVRRETGGWGWPAAQFAAFFAAAYLLSWTGYRLTNLLMG